MQGIPSGLSLPSDFGMYTRRTGRGLIRLLPELFRQFVQPLVRTVRLDVREALAVDPRCAAVGTAAHVGEPQNVAAVHLVVQGIEPIVGRVLRFGVQRRLQLPNLHWRC